MVMREPLQIFMICVAKISQNLCGTVVGVLLMPRQAKEKQQTSRAWLLYLALNYGAFSFLFSRGRYHHVAPCPHFPALVCVCECVCVRVQLAHRIGG